MFGFRTVHGDVDGAQDSSHDWTLEMPRPGEPDPDAAKPATPAARYYRRIRHPAANTADTPARLPPPPQLRRPQRPPSSDPADRDAAVEVPTASVPVAAPTASPSSHSRPNLDFKM